MSQNTSTAVMQRRVEPHDSLDDFPTPPWATRALMRHVLPMESGVCWEPACNRGFMVRPLREFFSTVHASDVFDYGLPGATRLDFLFEPAPFGSVDWIITNPPFRLAAEFILAALPIARRGVAVIVRSSFLEGVERYQRLFSGRPPTIFAPFAERVPMVKARCDPQATTATSYSWLIWVRDASPVAPVWIPPCRRQLERPGDYDLPEAPQ